MDTVAQLPEARGTEYFAVVLTKELSYLDIVAHVIIPGLWMCRNEQRTWELCAMDTCC